MCGISAVVSLGASTGASLETSKVLENSLDRIKHRGPDAKTQWISDDGRVALGHVRLAIKDLETGHQPLHDNDQSIHAVVNGELYEYDKLVRELSPHYHFKTRSDSELVIALYQHYGVYFLSKLRGEFALVLYDARRQLVLAARDRFGVKPLFYTVLGDKLLIASEAKAFLAFGWKPEWDVRSIAEDGWLHDERTMFRHVFKIRPGHYMVNLSFDYTTHRQYWEISFPDKHVEDTRTDDEMITGLREHLIEAVSVRLQSDVPIGIYLSGGIDSAAIAGITKSVLDSQCNGENQEKREEFRKKLICFGVGFDEGTVFDEMPLAQRTADWLGVPFVSKRMTEGTLADNFEDAVYHSEHHNPDLNSVAKFVLSSLPQTHGFKVVLSGEGSDEHFGGYKNFLPDFVREPDYSHGTNGISDSERAKITQNIETKTLPGYQGISQKFTQTASALARRMLNYSSISSCLWTVTTADFHPSVHSYGALSVQETRANNPDARTMDLMHNKWHSLHTSQYVWTKSILPNLILTCMGDRMEMAHSIEGRPPFLDHHLAEFVNRLPPSTKIRYDPDTGVVCEKWILREAAKPFITDEMYNRTKHPFTAPYNYTVGGPMHTLLSRLITHNNVKQLGFLEWDRISTLLDDAFLQKDATSMRFAFIVAQWVVISQKFCVAPAVL